MNIFYENYIKIKDLIYHFQIYLVCFSNIFGKLKSDKVDLFRQYVSELVRLNKKLHVQQYSADLGAAFKLYSALIKINNYVQDIVALINNYPINNSQFVDTSLSSFVIQDGVCKEKHIKNIYLQFNINDKQIACAVASELVKKITLDDLVDIDNLFREYPNTLYLFAHIMQFMLNIYPNSPQIINIIDNNKARALNDTKNTTGAGPRNPFLRSFGLVPSGDYLPPAKLFGQTNQQVNFENIANKEKVNILILQHITNNPINYRIWNLISQYTSNKAAAGISLDMINNTNIIQLLDAQKTSRFSSYEIYAASAAADYYILETLNNKTYRFLRFWTLFKNPAEKTIIKKNKIAGLLKYLGINTGAGANNVDRIASYQQIHNDVIAKNISMPPAAPNLPGISIDISSLKEKCMFRIKKIINDEYPANNKNFYRNPQIEFNKIMHSKKIIAAVIDTIVTMYRTYAQKTAHFSELFGTFLYELEQLKYNFGRALHNEYKKENNGFVANSAAHFAIQIEIIIDKVLNYLISQNNNLFQVLAEKIRILDIRDNYLKMKDTTI